MNNSVFGKIMENVRRHRDIKLVTSDKERNKLAIEMNKINVKINKPVYLHLSVMDVRKIPMYKYWYDCLKSKYVKKRPNYATLIQTASLSIWNQKTSMRNLMEILKRMILTLQL